MQYYSFFICLFCGFFCRLLLTSSSSSNLCLSLISIHSPSSLPWPFLRPLTQKRCLPIVSLSSSSSFQANFVCVVPLRNSPNTPPPLCLYSNLLTPETPPQNKEEKRNQCNKVPPRIITNKSKKKKKKGDRDKKQVVQVIRKKFRKEAEKQCA